MHVHVRCSLETVESVLHRLRSQVDVDRRRNVINVNREEVLDGARRGFRRATFNNKCTLSVKFSGKARIDDGGPTREFMRLVLKVLRDSHIFEGSENCKMLAVNIDGRYKYLSLSVIFHSLKVTGLCHLQ